MWFADLSPYTYDTTQDSDSGRTLNVGWLEPGHSFPTGEVSSTFVTRLAELVEHAVTNVARGEHYCGFCPSDVEIWGNSEIRAVGATGVRYAAPSMIEHYVVEHSYLPPNEFIDAVTRLAHVDADQARKHSVCMACGGLLERGAERQYVREGVPVRIVWFLCRGCNVSYRRVV